MVKTIENVVRLAMLDNVADFIPRTTNVYCIPEWFRFSFHCWWSQWCLSYSYFLLLFRKRTLISIKFSKIEFYWNSMFWYYFFRISLKITLSRQVLIYMQFILGLRFMVNTCSCSVKVIAQSITQGNKNCWLSTNENK